MKLTGIGLALALLASCGSTSSVKDLTKSTMTLSITDEEFVAQDAIRTVGFSLMSPSCLNLDPAVTARINGLSVPAMSGATQENAGVACNVPTWGSDLTMLDGGDLVFALSDSTGTATVTYVGGSELRKITAESSTLQGGTAARFDWSPGTDQITGVEADFENAGGTAWTSTAFEAFDGGFSFTPGGGGGTGVLQLALTAKAPVSVCTGFSACVDTVNVQRFIALDAGP